MSKAYSGQVPINVCTKIVAGFGMERCSLTEYTCKLLACGSQVQPQTIPKLELSAAVLLAKLLYSVKSELHIDLSAVHTWSDSMVALGWIRTNHAKLKTYVANRVIQITDKLPPVCWRHILTSTNPADVASRGTTALTTFLVVTWTCLVAVTFYGMACWG